MAGGAFIDESGHGGEYEEGRVTAFVMITCIVAAMGGLLFGYDIGISGLFLPIQVNNNSFLCFFVFMADIIICLQEE